MAGYYFPNAAGISDSQLSSWSLRGLKYQNYVDGFAGASTGYGVASNSQQLGRYTLAVNTNISLRHARAVWIALSASATVTFIDWTSLPSYTEVIVVVNPMAFTFTWGNAITWVGGAPTLTANTTSTLKLWSFDNGATIYGQSIALNQTLVPLVMANYVFMLGGTDQDNGDIPTSRTAAIWNMTTETLTECQRFMAFGTNCLHNGGVSNLAGKAYFSMSGYTGFNPNTSREWAMWRFDVTTLVASVLTTTDGFGGYNRTANAMTLATTYDYAYFPQAFYKSARTPYRGWWQFRFSTEIRSDGPYTDQFPNNTLHGAAVMSGSDRGYFGMGYYHGGGTPQGQKLTYSTLAWSTVSDTYDHESLAVLNNQADYVYRLGGVNYNYTVQNTLRKGQFSTDTLNLTLVTSGITAATLARGYGSNSTYGYALNYSSASALRLTFSSDTVANGSPYVLGRARTLPVVFTDYAKT